MRQIVAYVCFFCCFFFCFLCAMYAFYHICLFIISVEFDALHQLSVKKDPLEIQHPKLENSRRGPFMRDNGRCDILHAARVERYSALK